MPSDPTDATIALAGFSFEATRLELLDATGAPVPLRAQAPGRAGVPGSPARARGHSRRADVCRVARRRGHRRQSCAVHQRHALGDSAHRIVPLVKAGDGAAATRLAMDNVNAQPGVFDSFPPAWRAMQLDNARTWR
jgi:hypothetical protein